MNDPASEEVDTAAVPRRGRPRRFDDETEKTLLLDAAMDLLRTRGYADFGVADVLSASDLSTRSFYRHFESKEALHAALLRREVASVARRLTRAVDAAPDPVTAILAWIDTFLDTFLDPRLAERSMAFTAPTAMANSPLTNEIRAIREELAEPLASALRRGIDAGCVVSDEPDRDALIVSSIVIAAAEAESDRQHAQDHVRRFAWTALGIESA